MIKIVVFDSGYGGEFFADRFEEEVHVIDIIRVIDWRHANEYLCKPKVGRRLALEALRPYIGKVDLIIFANHLISATSLKFFQHAFPNQRFLGFKLKAPDTFIDRGTIILTTKAFSKTMEFHGYIFRIKRRARTIALDTWPEKIDDGELKLEEISETINDYCAKKQISPQEVVLGCSQFEDICNELRQVLGHNIRIYSSFNDTIREACKILRIRGSISKTK